MDTTLKVIYEDDELLVIDKPAGLVVSPTETQTSVTLADIIQEKYQIDLERAGIVHRLDKDTSGLILVAKTELALQNLQQQFKNRTVKKEYQALVHGQMGEGVVVDQPIGRNPANREKFVVLADGKPAKTEFKTLKHYQMTEPQKQTIFEGFNKIQMRKLERSNYQNFTLVSAFPFTGRTHQIRVHLKYLGYSIVGDEKYGGRKVSRLDARWCPRQFLHARKINFTHPTSGKPMEFESPLPADLTNALVKLETPN